MPYRVTVYEARWASVIQVGEGDRWTRGKAKQIERRARIRAPKRTQRLAASHVTLPTRGSNQFVKRYRISATAYYAHFVHGGTGIYGPRGMPVRTGGRMRLPGANPNRPGAKSTVIRMHRGQRPQPWLAQAARDVIGV